MATDGHKAIIAEAVRRVLEVDLQRCVQERLYNDGLKPDIEVEVSEISTLETQVRVTWPGTHRRYFTVKLSEML
jgi:hypothetical protein